MIYVIDVYNIRKFLYIFPFEKHFTPNSLNTDIPMDYAERMENDGHRYFEYGYAIKGGLNSFSPRLGVKFKVLMTIK